MRLPNRFVVLGLATIAVCFELIRSNTSLSYLSCVLGAMVVVAPIYILVTTNPILTMFDNAIAGLRERYDAAALPGERDLKLFQMNLGSLFFVQAVAAFFYLTRINTPLNIPSCAIISIALALFFRVFFDLPFFIAIGVEWIAKRLSSTAELDDESKMHSE
jgi:hypothetical protein